MADGFIVRKGGVTTEQALAPTITEVSTTETSITFTITNNDAETAIIRHRLDDITDEGVIVELATGSTSANITISGLTELTTFTVFATANVIGKIKSNVTEKEITTPASPFTEATGGTILEYDVADKRFRSHTFTSNGTFEVTNVGESNDDRNKVDYLIVAGGGAGGSATNGFDNTRAGGGGGGGYRTSFGTSGAATAALDKVTVTLTAFSIVVGAGGTVRLDRFLRGGNGGGSSALGVITSGGGAGGVVIENVTGANGGSGGGAGGGIGNAGGSGFAGQGSNGASTVAGNSGGGGGANTVGGNIGGGGGLNNTLRTGLNENRSRGGNGTNATTTLVNGATGAANTGTGGGGGGRGGSGGSGGSGIVVIRYEIAPIV